jgi:guanylate kinase
MNMRKEGILVIISGFSGVGKGTLLNRLMSEYPQDYALSVSATTRAPRAGEQEGVHYFFKTREEFEQMIASDALIEYAQYVDNYYGTPKKYVLDQMAAGRNVILEIEMQGAMKIKKQFPKTRLLFVSAPSAEEIKARLIGRGTESEEVIAQRMARAFEESKEMDRYDYLVINDNLEEAAERLHSIISKEQSGDSAANTQYLMTENLPFVKKMQKELESFSKGDLT